MKKLISMLLCLCLSLFFVGCNHTGNTEHTEHTFEWVINEQTHVKKYTCGCPSPDIAELHVDNNSDKICDICEFILPDHEHTYEYTHDDISHGWSYTCGCMTPPNQAQHFDADGNGKCDSETCGYEMSQKTVSSKVQTPVNSSEASLPHEVAVETERVNPISDGAIKAKIFFGHLCDAQRGWHFSNTSVHIDDIDDYYVELRVTYNGDATATVLSDIDYFTDDYRVYLTNIDDENGYTIATNVIFNKYHEVELDLNELAKKGYGYINFKICLVSKSDNSTDFGASTTLYYSYNETEVVFGIKSNPVAGSGTPGIIENMGWTYKEQ